MPPSYPGRWRICRRCRLHKYRSLWGHRGLSPTLQPLHESGRNSQSPSMSHQRTGSSCTCVFGDWKEHHALHTAPRRAGIPSREDAHQLEFSHLRNSSPHPCRSASFEHWARQTAFEFLQVTSFVIVIWYCPMKDLDLRHNCSNWFSKSVHRTPSNRTDFQCQRNSRLVLHYQFDASHLPFKRLSLWSSAIMLDSKWRRHHHPYLLHHLLLRFLLASSVALSFLSSFAWMACDFVCRSSVCVTSNDRPITCVLLEDCRVVRCPHRRKFQEGLPYCCSFWI